MGERQKKVMVKKRGRETGMKGEGGMERVTSLNHTLVYDRSSGVGSSSLCWAWPLMCSRSSSLSRNPPRPAAKALPRYPSQYLLVSCILLLIQGVATVRYHSQYLLVSVPPPIQGVATFFLSLSRLLFLPSCAFTVSPSISSSSSSSMPLPAQHKHSHSSTPRWCESR